MEKITQEIMYAEVRKANAEIKRIRQWVLDNEDAFDYMNLKLYDVSYYCYDDNGMKKDFPLSYANRNSDNYFGDFCDISYDMMKEDLMEMHNIDFSKMYNPLGRTSSFYLHDQNIIEINHNRKGSNIVIESVVSNWLYENFNYYPPCFDYNGYDGYVSSIDDLDEYDVDYRDDVCYIAEGKCYDEFVKYFQDVITVYDYIKDFKANQIDIFKDFMSYYEDDLRCQKDEEDNQEKLRQDTLAKFTNETVREIYNRNGLPVDDLNTLLAQKGE